VRSNLSVGVAHHEETQERVLEAVRVLVEKGQKATKDLVREQARVGKPDCIALLDSLCQKGILTREGAGVRGNAHHYVPTTTLDS